MQGTKLVRKVVVALVLLAGAGLLLSGVIWMTRSSPRSRGVVPTDQRVAVNDLLAMYQSDELTAEKSFGSAPLTVNGAVGIVDFTSTGDVSITLIDSNEHVLATALMLESSWPQAEKVSHGESVSLRCSSAMLDSSSLILRGCSFTR